MFCRIKTKNMHLSALIAPLLPLCFLMPIHPLGFMCFLRAPDIGDTHENNVFEFLIQHQWGKKRANKVFHFLFSSFAFLLIKINNRKIQILRGNFFFFFNLHNVSLFITCLYSSSIYKVWYSD